jgi:quinoprotein glucose dehydrogenase
MLVISGTLFALLGIGMAIAGRLSGETSSYHLLAGVGLLASGAFVANGNRAGAWIYMAVFGVTVSWALRNADLGGSPLVMRLVGPSVLLGMLALLMPILCQWRASKTTAVFLTLMAGTIALAHSSTADASFMRPVATITQSPNAHTNGVMS